MNQEFWLKKWQDGNIGFHQAKYHPQLEKNASQFVADTVLVPLCGKSLDMLYLSSKGYKVIGVELSPIACRSFFSETGINFTEKILNDFILFESEKITLWCGDFFQLPLPVWEVVSGIYDRAALIALPEEVRRKYVHEITLKSTNKMQILLITLEYKEGAMQGPPFSVSFKEVKNLFDKFDINKLNSTKEIKTIEITESVYWLKKS